MRFPMSWIEQATMSLPKPLPGVLDISPYVGGRASADDGTPGIKMSANESALGPSPLAVAAYKAASADLHRYPDGGADDLRQAIAERFDIESDRIVCGNGSDDLLSLMAELYAAPGDEVLFTEHSFGMYRIIARTNGATAIEAPLNGFRTDVEALIAAANERTKIVYIANPSNPTGTYLTGAELGVLHSGLPESCMLVIDSAYGEFANFDDYDIGIELCRNHENVVMTRTFSKLYGLAGLRVGWAYCAKEVADLMHRIRMPFNVSIPAERAAIAALGDTDFVTEAIAHNTKWRGYFETELTKLGLDVVESAANFLLIGFGDGDAALSAAAADKYLSDHGYLLRRMEGYGFPNHLRLSVSRAEDNEALVALLTDFLKVSS